MRDAGCLELVFALTFSFMSYGSRHWERSQQPLNATQQFLLFDVHKEWSGGATVLGKLPVPGRPTI